MMPSLSSMLLKQNSRYRPPARLSAGGLALLTSLFAALAPAVGAEMLIGAVGPLTGPNAYLGEQHQQGAEAAVADINAAGGVLGQLLRLTVLDDACDSGQAVAAAHQLAAGKV